MNPVEIISAHGLALAYIIRSDWMPTKTEFLTPDHLGQQMGMIVYDAGQHIQPHLHLPIVREVHGTTECIVVRKGKCAVDLYDAAQALVATCELRCGDIVLLLEGGHGFRMHEDTVLFEVKQGPYAGVQDKLRFDPSEEKKP